MYKIEYRQRNHQHANTAQKQEKKTEIIIAICTEKKQKHACVPRIKKNLIRNSLNQTRARVQSDTML